MICPTPEKRWIADRYVAERMLAAIWRHGKGPVPRRAYECVCGGWHLTKSMTEEVVS